VGERERAGRRGGGGRIKRVVGSYIETIPPKNIMDSPFSSCGADPASSSFCDSVDHAASIVDLIARAAATASALGIAALLLMQMDGVSRRLLSPDRLLAYVPIPCPFPPICVLCALRARVCTSSPHRDAVGLEGDEEGGCWGPAGMGDGSRTLPPPPGAIIVFIFVRRRPNVHSRILTSSTAIATCTFSFYRSKRRREYQYAVTQSSEYNSLMIRQHVGGGGSLYDPKSESRCWEIYDANDAVGMAALIADILSDDDDDDGGDGRPSPVIVALERDATDEDDPDTYHLFLAFPPPLPAAPASSSVVVRRPYRRMRVPLLPFCDLLANAFERRLTSTTFCFVADASSGLGIEVLTTLVARCDVGVVSER
jgi:hypothetical protein